jgi:hypothetical protein
MRAPSTQIMETEADPAIGHATRVTPLGLSEHRGRIGPDRYRYRDC